LDSFVRHHLRLPLAPFFVWISHRPHQGDFHDNTHLSHVVESAFLTPSSPVYEYKSAIPFPPIDFDRGCIYSRTILADYHCHLLFSLLLFTYTTDTALVPTFYFYSRNTTHTPLILPSFIMLLKPLFPLPNLKLLSSHILPITLHTSRREACHK
jgi:hypothetical protein